jgi:hypothetical protein
MISASFSRRSVCNWATFLISAARWATVEFFDHSPKALSAAASAFSMSASVAVGYSRSTLPVAGLTTAYMFTGVFSL